MRPSGGLARRLRSVTSSGSHKRGFVPPRTETRQRYRVQNSTMRTTGGRRGFSHAQSPSDVRARRPLLGRARFSAQIERAVDQADVAIGLREVAQHPTSARVELLGEEANIVAVGQQPFKQLARFDMAPLQYVVVDEPEAAH